MAAADTVLPRQVLQRRYVDKIQILEQADIPGADLRVAVAGQLQEVDLAGNAELPDQIGEEMIFLG